jgi:putative membrane protein
MEQRDHPNHALAFVIRLVVSAGVLWLAVGWVSPGNPYNTFGRAVIVSLLLSAAYYLTLARFLWFLLVPWLLYVLVWLVVIRMSYGLHLLHSLLLALALTALSWVASALLGVRPLRAE